MKTATKSLNKINADVQIVLDALQEICIVVPDMPDSARKELSAYLTQLADAFKAEAPEETKVPRIDEVTMNMADISRVMLDTFGLA